MLARARDTNQDAAHVRYMEGWDIFLQNKGPQKMIDATLMPDLLHPSDKVL
jgi:hypothetical protein